MHYLGLALYAEGPTDYYFLCPLLRRLCEAISANDSPHPVEFSDVLALDDPVRLKGDSREERIVGAAKAARGAWRILFVHADGAGSPPAKRAQQVQPALDRLRRELSDEGIGVAVVPVRETEAWAIHDGDVLRRVFGTTLDDAALGLPSNAAGAESVLDPKANLSAAFKATRPSGPRRKQGTTPMLNALGEQVSLERLRMLSAFRALEAEVRHALKELRVIP